MKTGTTLVLAVLCAAVGFVLGSAFFGGAAPTTIATDGTEQENRELRSRVERLEAEKAENIREAEREDAEAKRAEDELAAARDEASAVRAATTADASQEILEGTEVAAGGPRFFAKEYDGALGRVDWSVVGKNMSQLSELIPRIATKLAAGQSPDLEDLGRVQELNGPLIRAAGAIQEDLPGSFVNGKFSDPAFMVNAMVTTLAMTEHPLASAQETALEATARSWMAKDRQRREGYDDRTWMVQKLYEEAELKDGFFAEAFGHLTAAQVEILSPALVRGRVRLDLFSSSLIFASLSRPDFFKSREALVESTLSGVSANLRLSEEDRTLARPVIVEWVERLPRVLTEHETDALDAHGLIPVGLITAAARQQERLVRNVVAALAIDEERMAGVRDYPVIHVPLPRRETEPEAD